MYDSLCVCAGLLIVYMQQYSYIGYICIFVIAVHVLNL